ncbi:hypothetical protein LINGRAHAP2_LOCUS682 [Linum grandiflorum]
MKSHFVPSHINPQKAFGSLTIPVSTSFKSLQKMLTLCQPLSMIQYLCTNHSSNNLRQFHLSRTYRSLQWKQSHSSRTLDLPQYHLRCLT